VRQNAAARAAQPATLSSCSTGRGICVQREHTHATCSFPMSLLTLVLRSTSIDHDHKLKCCQSELDALIGVS